MTSSIIPRKPQFQIGDAVFPNIDVRNLGITGIGRIKEMEWEYKGNPDAWFYYVKFDNANETHLWIVESALRRVAGV